MSHLLHNQVRIAITPDKVVGVRFGRGFSRQVMEKHLVPCTETFGLPMWQAAIAALTELLSRLGKAPADASVILSDRFMRYVLIPWEENLTTPEEELAFARHCFARIYGTAADHWELRLSNGGGGETRVAGAVDEGLLLALREACAKTRLKLHSIQPHLMAAFNRWCRSLTGDCLFVLAEQGTCSCATFRNGRWQTLCSESFSDVEQDLPLIIDRENLTAELAEHPVAFVYAPEKPLFTATPGHTWSLKPLVLPPAQGFSPYTDAAFALSMVAD